VQGMLLAAAISPDNTPHGYNLTFAFPELMFIIIAAVLYLRFRSPHRVPGQTTLATARQEVAGPAHDGTTAGSTLHEDPVGEGPVVDGPADEATAQESEDSE
jgi:hypothetical protein